MTLQQLRYSIAIEDCGSLLQAAEKLHLSQPSLSVSIKELERELGYPLFKRSNRGISSTSRGALFITQARGVLRQCDELKKIGDTKRKITLTIAAPYYSPVMESFLVFTKQNLLHPELSFELINGQSFAIIDIIDKQEADLGILLNLADQDKNWLEYIEERKLIFTPVCRLPFAVRLRRGHPLLKKDTFSLSELAAYPIVHYREKMKGRESDYFEQEEFRFINKSQSITVFDRDIKNRIVNESDAYSIGLTLHPNFARYYDHIDIPIRGKYAELGYLHHPNRELSREAQAFIEILKDEIKTVQVKASVGKPLPQPPAHSP